MTTHNTTVNGTVFIIKARYNPMRRAHAYIVRCDTCQHLLPTTYNVRAMNAGIAGHACESATVPVTGGTPA